MNLPVEIAQFIRWLERLGDGWSAVTIIGVFSGALALATIGRLRQHGVLATVAVGVCGTLLGAWTARRIGLTVDGLGTRFLVALAGSLVLAWSYDRLVARLRRERHDQGW